MAKNALARQLADLLVDPLPAACAAPVGGNLFVWHAALQGPPGSVFEGGTFFLELRFPESYPFNPPHVTFLTPVWPGTLLGESTHPQTLQVGQSLCPCGSAAHILSRHEWSPALTARAVLQRLLDSMAADAAEPRSEAGERAQQWTYAAASELPVPPELLGLGLAPTDQQLVLLHLRKRRAAVLAEHPVAGGTVPGPWPPQCRLCLLRDAGPAAVTASQDACAAVNAEVDEATQAARAAALEAHHPDLF